MESLVFTNMLHRPTRTIVSIVGIAVGVLLIVFTVGLANGSMRERAKREGNVGAELFIRASGSLGLSGSESFRLDEDLEKKLAAIPGVQSIAGVGQAAVTAEDTNSGSRLVDGIDYDKYASLTGIYIVEGRPLAETGDEALIDTGFQAQKKYKIGDKINIFERDFVIVGTYEPVAGARIKLPLRTLQQQYGSEGKVSTFLVKLSQGQKVEDVAERIHQRFPDLQIIRASELEELYMQGFPALNTFLDVFIGIAAIISALVILLTMYTTVTERTRQIGILKSLGMSRLQIAWTIAKEAILISIAGTIIGIIFTLILREFTTRFTALNVEISPKVIGLVFIVGIIGGIAGSIYPALRSARLDPVEALSYE